MRTVEIVRLTGLPFTTVARHLKQGFCPWPRYSTGTTEHPLYKTWENMKSRCYNPNATGFENYGGRGIRVCGRWYVSFENFATDMGPRPEGMTLDRVDVNGDYTLDNCRWSTTVEQANNTRQERTGHVSRHGRKYRARFGNIRLGSHATPEAAQLAIDEFKVTERGYPR